MAKDFKKDTLVWAKMKGFPPWPAKIAFPKDRKTQSTKKPQHYVFFFGTHDFAWIPDQCIEPHSEEMLSGAKSYRKKSSNMICAIDEIQQACKKDSKKRSKLLKEDNIKKEPLDSPPDQLPLLSLPSTPDMKPKLGKSQKRKEKLESETNVNIKFEKKTHERNHMKTTRKRSASDISNDLQVDLDIKVMKDLDFNYYLENESSTSNDPISDLSDSDRSINGIFIPTMKKIGFLGLGMMGRQMVQRLLTTKHSVTIWNRRSYDDFNYFLEQGAKCARNPAAVIQECDITICCVSDSEAVKSVVYGKYGVLEGFDGVKGRKSYVDMSSIDATTSEEVAEAITGKGGRYLEAPMMGQRQDVNNNSMVILAAGNKELFNECYSMFAAWAQHVFYLGMEVGQANNTSLILNMMAASTYAALGESLAVMERCNVAPSSFMKVMSHSPCAFPLLMNMGHAMASNDQTVTTPVKHLQKNLFAAISLGGEAEQPLQIAVAANSHLTRAMAHEPESDVSSIRKWV